MSVFGDIVSSEPRDSFFLPPGVVMPYAGTADVAPSGWLFCNGFSHSRTTYSNLYSIIGDTYGDGNGSTTFNVPDLRRKMVLGFGTTTTGTAVGASGGSWDHTHAGPAHTHSLSNHTHGMQNHTHTISHNHNMSHTHGISGNVSGYTVGGPGNNRFMAAPDTSVKNPFTGTTAVQPAASNPATFTNSFQIRAAIDGGQNTDGASSSTTGPASDSGSGPPSTNTTEGASPNTSGTAGTGQTSSANPPYITLQYIIKV